MDRRQQKTRAAIFDAFGRLLSKKVFSQITVQEIIDEANVGRSTFYAHFSTKDALLRELCTDLFEHVFSDHLITETTHDFSGESGSYHTIITHMLYHLRDNRKNIIGILTCESGELFLQFFKQYLNTLVSRHILNDDNLKNLSVPQEFLINHISGSFINMVQWWIKGGLKETPEELTKYFEIVINPILSQS